MINVWISKKRFYALEKRVADLECEQLKSAKMVKDYIEDSESLSNKLSEEIKNIPQKILEHLKNHGFNE